MRARLYLHFVLVAGLRRLPIAGRSYIEVHPLQGTGVGVWRATDARSGEVIVEWPNRNESRRQLPPYPGEGYYEGWTTLRSTYTISEDAMAFSGT